MDYDLEEEDRFDDEESLGDPESGWIEDGLHWGNWQLNEKEQALAYIEDRRQWVYGISLVHLRNPHQFAEWLAQLSDKSWMTPQIIGDFVAAVNEIFSLRSLSQCGVGQRVEPASVFNLKNRRVVREEDRRKIREMAARKGWKIAER